MRRTVPWLWLFDAWISPAKITHALSKDLDIYPIESRGLLLFCKQQKSPTFYFVDSHGRPPKKDMEMKVNRCIRLPFFFFLVFVSWEAFKSTYLKDASAESQALEKLMKTQGCYQWLNCAWTFGRTKWYPNDNRMNHNTQLQNLQVEANP